jgi:hypothetical protein
MHSEPQLSEKATQRSLFAFLRKTTALKQAKGETPIKKVQ